MQELAHMLYDRRDFFQGLVLEHVRISGTAALTAAGLGVFLGVCISEHARLARWVMTVANVVYTIPAIAMFGFLIPLTGIGNTTAVIALALYGLLPVIGQTCAGLAAIDPDIIEAARGMGSSRRQLLLRIKLPLALPVILAALRTMVVMTIALTGIAAFIGAGGLGVAIYRGIATNNAVLTVAGSVLIALTALVFDSLCHALEKQIPWKRG